MKNDNIISLTTTQPQGEITITVRDAKTLEPKHVIVEKNTITQNFYYNFAQVRTGGYSVQSGTGYQMILLSPTKIVPTVSVQRLDKTSRVYYQPNTALNVTRYSEGNPSFSEVEWRFNQPPALRTIWSIFLTPWQSTLNTTTSWFGSYVTPIPSTVNALIALNTPCTQDTNEVLDVKYRILIDHQNFQASPSSLPALDDVSLLRQRAFWGDTSTALNRMGELYSLTSSWQKCSSDNTIEPVQTNQDLISVNVVNFGYVASVSSVSTPYCNIPYKSTWNISMPANAGPYFDGQLFGTNKYGRTGYTVSGGYTLQQYHGFRTLMWAPVLPPSSPTFPTKPIQPVHNHSASADQPFLDVDNLASSQGDVFPDGSAWTDPDWPMFYRTEYTKTGGVGTSRYFFRKRPTVGFVCENSTSRHVQYRSRNEQAEYWTYSSNSNFNTVTELLGTTDHHGVGNVRRVVEYDFSKILAWSNSGVSIVDLVNGDNVIFDSTRLSGFNVVSIAQVVVIGPNKDVLVACRSSGLYKISDCFGTPSVTHYSNSVHGVPLGNGNNDNPACYGIAEGYNGRIWAMFDQGLGYSDNGGINWTNLNSTTTPAFNVVGISDDNWANTKFIRVNKSAAGHEIGIIKAGLTATTAKVVWYTPASGGISHTCTFDVSDSIDHFNVSDTGSTWLAVRWNGGTTMQICKLFFGLNSLYPRFGKNYDYIRFHTLMTHVMYDYYGTPIVTGPLFNQNYYQWNQTTGIFEGHTQRFVHIDQNSLLDTNDRSNYDSTNPFFFTSKTGSPNVFNPVNSTTYNKSLVKTSIGTWPGSWNESNQTYGFVELSDSLNQEHSVSGESIWSRYHWNSNSSQWIQDYYSTAAETATHASGPFPGIRHNFDTESHAFNGRSVLDVSNVITSGNFTTQMTFVANITPQPKRDYAQGYYSNTRQEQNRTLFSVFNTSTKTFFEFDWDTFEYRKFPTYSDTNTPYDYWSTSKRIMGVKHYPFNFGFAIFGTKPLYTESGGWGKSATFVADMDNNSYWCGADSFASGAYVGYEFASHEQANWPTISSFTFRTSTASATTIKIQKSDDFITWTDLWTITSPALNTDHVATITPTQAKYFRLTGSGGGGNARVTTFRPDFLDNFNISNTGTSASRINPYYLQEDVGMGGSSTGGELFEPTCVEWATTVTTPVDNTSYRFVGVLDGTTFTYYIDGVLQQSVTLKTAVDLTTAMTDLRMIIGAGTPPRDSMTPSDWLHPKDFFRGTMTNIQIWNVAWDAVDVSNDMGNINGVIVSKPSSNLIARYMLTESLEGTETKATHSALEDLDDGITIRFADGVSGNSFVATDYHTFGVYDGIMKDNATQWSQQYQIFNFPTDLEYDEFKDMAGSTSIVPSTTTQVTDAATFITGNNVNLFKNAVHTIAASTIPGYMYAIYYGSYASNGTSTVQKISGDGYFEFTCGTNDLYVAVGLGTTYGGTYTTSTINYHLCLNSNNTVDIREGLTLVATNVETYTAGDVFRIQRTGNTITYWKRDTSMVFQLIGTSATPSSGPLYGRMTFDDAAMWITDCKVNYTAPAGMMSVGNRNTLTGSFDPNFLILDDNAAAYNILIDGTPVSTVNIVNADYDSITAPAPGQVTVHQTTGWLFFNAADQSKTITGTIPLVYYRF